MKYKRADGQTARPSLVVIDDPQTDESARSLSQCAARESILAGAVLGLAGPGKKIAGVMPCTVKRAVRHVLFDTNYWKTFIHSRLAVPMGDRGCLSLFGDHPERHRLFADHITAEYRVKTEGRGRAVDEWKLRPEASENHWLDGLVGCAVAASIQGVTLSGMDLRPAAKRPRVKLSELQRKRS